MPIFLQKHIEIYHESEAQKTVMSNNDLPFNLSKPQVKADIQTESEHETQTKFQTSFVENQPSVIQPQGTQLSYVQHESQPSGLEQGIQPSDKQQSEVWPESKLNGMNTFPAISDDNNLENSKPPTYWRNWERNLS